MKQCEVYLDGPFVRCLHCDWFDSSAGVLLPVRRHCTPLPANASPERPLTAIRQSIQQNGPERTDAEVLFIITNFCQHCPAWNSDPRVTKKCKHCGCGSTETIENLHRRRIRSCPKRGNHPAKWDEALLQRQMHQPPQPLADVLP